VPPRPDEDRFDLYDVCGGRLMGMEDGPPLRAIGAENFRNLRAVDVQLGPVNVLVGPNGAGKSNLLDVVAFLGDIVRQDLVPALRSRGGFGAIYFHGKTEGPIRLKIRSKVAGHGTPGTPDEYMLAIRGSRPPAGITRHEAFTFTSAEGPERRITVRGGSIQFSGEPRLLHLGLRPDVSALSILPRLEQGGEDVARLAELFGTFRVFDVDVGRARQPSLETSAQQLEPDGANLASFLAGLREQHPDIFEELVDDAAGIIPGLRQIKIEPAGGSGRAVAVLLAETGLSEPTPLAYASFGTIRLLAILALLHDPNPPC
jgi:predicted ATPase